MSRKAKGGKKAAAKARDQEELARLTQQIAARAVRRLDMLEWVIMGGAALAAVVGGALVAFLLSVTLGFSFRLTWIVTSMVFFVVPGWLALRRVKREEREDRERILKRTGTSDV